jgi:hypothetical protein
MSADGELETARVVIAKYGADAECVAAGHAETHAEMGEDEESARWRRIAGIIARLQSPARRAASD